jgi:hydroxypyruvate reductase
MTEKTALRADCERIVREAVRRVQPDAAVRRALEGKAFDGGRLIVVAVGKAAWSMAKTAAEVLGDRLDGGIVITKYGHARGPIPPLTIREAGHPVPDENGFAATAEALEMTAGLRRGDTVLFLLSGGGSALFESPLIEPEELRSVTGQLLASGADIVEINTVRKRLSAVKGGRFAEHCAPARVFGVVLSDVLGDPPDMIASGPACPDGSRCADALSIADKYGLKLSARAWECLRTETPKRLSNAATEITGSVRELCAAAAACCRELGYEPLVLTDRLACEAREAGRFLAAIAQSHRETEKPLAFIAGGETVVHVTGKGLGGRNQELALAAAETLAGLSNAAVFSFGSDGTDGPTDAAGGYADGETAEALRRRGVRIEDALRDNDAYHALGGVGGLIVTGPTGTNVNDAAVVLIRPRKAACAASPAESGA